ncbi:MAG: methylmalonyl-CoA mutase [Ponticaulis sp.]|nr:methylmalonyl-CoA mutase [Ponticaulis sp.]|tara:strand:- start:36561 stop:38564 length:2004 start_codon:yes stop_codon:yes gene_type:complete
MADEALTSFSASFPEADEASWRALVEKALKGKPPESLERKTRDGITIKPLYREDDWPSATDPDGQPGDAPFIRGPSALKDGYLPWDIRQVVAHPDLKSANAELIKDLERGVSSIELRLDASGENGVAVQALDDFDILLDGVMTDLAPIALTNSALEGFGLEGAALLIAWAEKKGLDPAKQLFSFNVDPIGELARSGALATPMKDALAETAGFVRDYAPGYSTATFIRVDGRPAYECGGTEAQELAFAIASGVTYLRALLDAGVSLEAANNSLLFSLSVGPNYALEIAKLRAARRLWARITESFGETLPMKLQAVSARRMLTQRDPWVNMLRNTAACFAGGVGGADIVTVRPFTDAIGLAGNLARRIGRNTQIMAQEESSLGKVTDPAAGTWSIGKISDDLAQSAWTLFQTIEGEGGISASLTSGSFQVKLSEARKALQKDIARRKQAVTGVSEFALIEEETPPIVDLSGLPAIVVAPKGPTPASRAMTDLVKAARDGASLNGLLCPERDPHAQCDPFFPMRLSEPYELLRDHADAKAERPRVFLACLGSVAEHNARASFAANFFAAGGIGVFETDPPYETLETMAEDFRRSDALIAVICGTDGLYAEKAALAAQALRSVREDARIYLAGRPGAAEAAYREAGIDDFIYVGVDVVSKLEIAHAELGLS